MKQLLKIDQLNRVDLNKWLKEELDELINFFKNATAKINYIESNSYDSIFLETDEVSLVVYLKLVLYADDLVKNCDLRAKNILNHAYLFDFSKEIKGNGYRTLVRSYDSCCRHLLLLLNDLSEKKNKIFFSFNKFSFLLQQKLKLNHISKELQAWVSKSNLRIKLIIIQIH